MTAARNASKARLGVFVVSGLVLAVAGALALGAARILERYVPLHCYFAESVQGLDKGSPISYRGVQLGRVSQVLMRQSNEGGTTAMGHQAVIEVVCDLYPEQLTRFGSAAPSEQEILLAIRREVSQGLRVRVAWKDITGQKYLDLDYVDPAKSPPGALAFTPPGTYIPTAVETKLADIQRDVANVTSRLAQVDYQGIAEDARSAVTTLRKAIEDLDAAGLGTRFGEAADSVRRLASNADLASSLRRLDSVLEKADAAAARIGEVASRPSLTAGLDDIAASAASLRRMTAQLEESIPRLTQSAEETLASARSAIDAAKLQDTAAAVRGTMTETGNAARQVAALREDGRRTLADLGEAARGLARLVKFLEENPDALLRGKTEKE